MKGLVGALVKEIIAQGLKLKEQYPKFGLLHRLFQETMINALTAYEAGR